MTSAQCKEIYELRNKKENKTFASFLKGKIGRMDIEEYPVEIKYYLAYNREKVILYNEEIINIDKKIHDKKAKLISNVLERLFSRKEDLTIRIRQLNQESNILKEVVSELSNNERLWATVVYMWLSSYLIDQKFPRIISINIHCLSKEDMTKGLNLLRKFSPAYHIAFQQMDKGEECFVYIVSCQMSKWDYYLYLHFLKQIGKIYEIC